jgi:hypothetical protein
MTFQNSKKRVKMLLWGALPGASTVGKTPVKRKPFH